MTELEKIIELLTGGSSPERTESLLKLFQAVKTAHDEGGAKKVKSVLEEQMAPLKDRFEDAYLDLRKKMGM